MGTTAVSVLETMLGEAIGDDLEFDTTTNITTDNLVISTTLRSYDGGRNDFYIDYWLYITEGNNITVLRQISDYATSSGTLTVRGDALAAESGAVTCRLHLYNRDLYINAINDAIRETFPTFHKTYDIMELVTGNILPNSHFRDWAVATAPDKYSMQDSNITATAIATAGTYRGGGKAMKALTGASGAGKYVYISSNTYPRLLDLMGQQVSLYAWALPEAANDAFIEIYTLKADTTAQTLTSTTACPIGKYTLLKLEDQTLNDDLVEIQIRFKVATASKYVYFDHARLIGRNQQEYLLPTDIVNGKLSSVQVQTDTYSDRGCDDLLPRGWEDWYDWEIVDDGIDKFLRFGMLPIEERLIRLRGYAPLSAIAAYTSTIEIDGNLLSRFLAYAKYKLYQAIEGPVASSDIGRYESQSAKAYGEYLRLSHIRMNPPKTSMKIRGY